MKLAVVVTPKSGRDEVIGWRESSDGNRELAVRVTAPPEKGKATKVAGKVLAAFFGVPKGSVECTRGAASRHKIFEIPITEEVLEQKVPSMSSD